MDISQLTLREKIGQTMMVNDFERFCDQFGSAEAFLEAYPIGMVYLGGSLVGERLFGKDYMTTPNVKAAKAAKCPILFGGDMEFGRVQHGMSPMPSLMNLGATNDLELAYEYGRTIGYGAIQAGNQWVFGPCVDLNVNPDNQVILTRSIGDNPERASALLREMIRGIEDCGVIACAKHFPGLGSENVDSHIAPIGLPLSKEEWNNSVRKVYETLIADGLSSIMTAHVPLPAFQTPLEDGSYSVATVSEEITQKLLKDGLNFNGVVVTDALAMGGLSGSSVDLEIASFLAGSDVLLWPSLEYMDVLEQKILNGEISEERLNEKAGLFDENREVPDVSHIPDVAQKIAEKSITLLNNKRGLLPLDPNKIKKVFMVAVTPVEKQGIRLPVLEKLKDILTERGIEVVFKADAWLSDLRENADCDLNLFVIDRPPMLYHGSKDIFGENGASVWASQASDKDKTLIVTFGNPYIYAKYYQGIEHYINAYDPCEMVFKAFVRAIFGEIPFEGVSPVELKAYYKQ